MNDEQLKACPTDEQEAITVAELVKQLQALPQNYTAHFNACGYIVCGITGAEDIGGDYCGQVFLTNFDHDPEIINELKQSSPAVQVDGETSDGYHTFNELYEHRHSLFIALMRSHPKLSWRANNHEDGSNYNGWFVAGMHLPTGDVSYHLPAALWQELDNYGIDTSNRAPKWDGHISNDVIKRIRDFLPPKAATRPTPKQSLTVDYAEAAELLKRIVPYPHHMLLDTATMPNSYAHSKWQDIPKEVQKQIIFNMPISLFNYLKVKAAIGIVEDK